VDGAVTSGRRSELDLAIRGGRLVTAASDGPADVGIRDGRVVALGLDVGPAEQEIDATGRLVLPGAVDAHVHFTPIVTADRELHWADTYESGSRAAAAGGVTTFGDIAFALPGEPLALAMKRIRAEAESASMVDFLLHPVLLDPSPERRAEIPVLADDGFTSLKMFMHMGGFDSRVGEYLEALELAGQHGLTTLVHAEDACTISHLTKRLVEQGRSQISNFPRTRPVVAETVAVERAVALAEVSGAPIYLVHLSSAEAVAAANRARDRGVLVDVETRPIYLLFDESEFDGPEPGLYVGNPPLRTPDDVAALWRGLESGRISTCCTDHAPWRREDKLDPAVDVRNTRPGMADLETSVASLYSEGVRRGRLSLRRWVEVTSTNAARIFGAFPRKGTISVGSDADVVVFDPDRRWTVRGADLQTAARTTLLEGRELVGRPMTTVSRGEVVMDEGRIVGRQGRGRHVTRVRG
jgi:dihydropyrimidinase